MPSDYRSPGRRIEAELYSRVPPNARATEKTHHRRGSAPVTSGCVMQHTGRAVGGTLRLLSSGRLKSGGRSRSWVRRAPTEDQWFLHETLSFFGVIQPTFP